MFILFLAPKYNQYLFTAVRMQFEAPLLTIRQILECLHQERLKAQPSCVCFLASTYALVVDASNYLSKAQKLTLIDHTDQQATIDVFLQGNQPNHFAAKVEFGDIVHLNNFQFLLHESRVVGHKSSDLSSFAVIPGYKEDNCIVEEKAGSKQLSTTSATDLQIRMLRRFGRQFFQSHQVPLQYPSNHSSLNPEEIGTKNKFFDIIARVVDCKEREHSYEIRMTDQNNEFVMEFDRHVDPGVYKVRGITAATRSEAQMRLTPDLFTNFLKIQPWMRSYSQVTSLPKELMQQSKQPVIFTRLLRKDTQLPRKSLMELLTQNEHHDEVIVSCEILEIDTPFSEAFKRIVLDTQNDRKKYKEEDYHSDRGQLITKVRLSVTDPSMKGEAINVYLYPFDSRGKEFIPELDPFELKDSIIKQPFLLEQRYLSFVNNVLEKTSYETKPLELILSPMHRQKRRTIFRIVDTQLIIGE